MLIALMPHGSCFLWNPWLTFLHSGSDGLIVVAYFSIPVMMYLNRNQATPEIRKLILLFAAFILSCGVGHLLSAWNIWHDRYWIEGSWKAVTAIISLYTAVELAYRMPAIMGFHRRLSETETLASTDLLTGLKNRRGFELGYQHAQSMDLSSGYRNILMLLDLDRFKAVNDALGHDAGDRLLQEIATVLTKYTRSADTVARMGGDEFAILLVGCSSTKARLIAQVICQEIEKVKLEDRFETPNSEYQVTCSVGLIETTPELPLKEALQQVDQLMYVSKRKGRNQITVSTRNSLSPTPAI